MSGMMPTPPDGPDRPELRVSDADREHIIDVLRQATSEGRLTLDEFGERVGATYAARTPSELEPLLRDLPVLYGSAPAPPAGPGARGVPPLPGPMAPPVPGVPAPPSPPAVPSRPPNAWTVAVLSGAAQKGRWRIRGEHHAIAIMGSCELDLRNCEIEGPEAVITAFVFMGGIDVVVPEGVAVELEGFVFMGAKDARRVRNVPVIPGSPLIRVRAYGLMGGISVRSKPVGVDRDTRRQVERDVHHGERDVRHADRDAARNRQRGPRRGLPLPEVLGAAVGEDPGATSQLRSAAAPDGTVTILFSDIEGFTALNDRLGDLIAQQVLRDHNDIIRAEIAKQDGFEVKNQGDGFMVAFSSASRALRCAIGIQGAFQSYNAVHPDTTVRVRVGMHTGEATRDQDDFLGGTVNLAARITEQARGGEVFVSSVLKELCDTTGEFRFGDAQEVELKGISQPRRIHRVLWGSV
jgi:class 3 adenylate cyclase